MGRSMSDMQQIIMDKLSRVRKLMRQKALRMPFPERLLAKEGCTLALTARDWHDLTPEILLEHDKPVREILALDDEVAWYAHCCDIPVILAEDVLPGEQLASLLREADSLARTWFAPLERFYRIDGICWPDVDSGCLKWFWEESLLAEALARSLAQRGRELVGIVRTPYVAPEHYYGIDNFGRALMALDPERDVITLDGPCGPMACTGQEDPVIGSLVGTPFDPFAAADIEDSVVCALPPSDIGRFTPTFFRTGRRLKQGLIVLTSGGSHERRPFPVHIVPPPPAIRDDSLFRTAWQKFQDMPLGKRECLRPAITACLRQYHEVRWPMLLHWAERFQLLFSTFRPACVLGTDLYEAESRLPLLVAKKLGIPTAAFSHAELSPCTSWKAEYADKLLLSNIYSARCAQNAGIPSRSIINTEPLERIAEAESSSSPWPPKTDADEVRLFVLLPPARLLNTASVSADVRVLDRLIKEIMAPPQSERRFTVRFWRHPVCGNSYPLASAGLDDMPIYGDLSLLPAADICISFGEGGEPLLQASRQLPTILVLADELAMRAASYGEVLRTYPTVCHTAEELWPLILRIVENTDLRAQMLQQQQFKIAGPLPQAVSFIEAVKDIIASGQKD